MTDPNSYSKSSTKQVEECKWFLDKIAHQLNYKNEEKILDVGCGPGEVLTSVRKYHLPRDCSVVGADISEDMVQLARSRFEEVGLTFKLLDISSPNFWMNWLKHLSSFDKIFSIYCLQWVKDVKQSIENFNLLLKDGGDLVIMAVLGAPYFPMFQAFYNDPQLSKFRPVMKNFALTKVGTDYDGYLRCLESSGFEIISSETIVFPRSYANQTEWRTFADSISPFLPLLKEEEKREFSDKTAKFLKEQGLVKVELDGSVNYTFEVIGVHARKVRPLDT